MGRLVATSAAMIAVAACGALALGMGRAAGAPDARYEAGAAGSADTTAAAHHASAAHVYAHLPVAGRAHNATRVITVAGRSRSSTTATLQAWTKVKGGWVKHGHAVTANLGSDGLSSSPSEWKSATPIGSFTLTQAFGRDANPGTKLPYFRTRPSDWWISQTPNKLYNTHQRCSSHCGFRQGSPNEHLYYEAPYYDYAVVIDYNTRNAPGGVKQGAGSAFFLHVAPYGIDPTQGCVSIPVAKLKSLMRWLTPSAHPRIIIGVR